MHLFTSRDVALQGDAREWEAVASSLGVETDHLRLIRQVHGANVTIARRGRSSPWRPPHADVIVTDDPDVAIGVRVADCAPILLLDMRKGIVGAVHAGWRGTAAGAAAAAVRAMQDAFGSDPAALVAAIGPCLGSCCGEVGEEVVEAFRAAGHQDAERDGWLVRGRGPRPFLDLERANRDQLAAGGVPAASIHASGLCTKTHHDRLHSYRVRREAAGRLLAAIRCPQ